MSTVEQTLKAAYTDLAKTWDQEVIPQLVEYIKIPNKSPMFDADWQAHGYMSQAMQLLVKWAQTQAIAGMKLNLLEEPGRTPLLLIDIPGQSEETILLYGHMDKQPEMRGWREGLGPWQPVLEDGKLYGRGGADDGYAIFSALTAIAQLQRCGIAHARCLVLIEASEESGSVDLPFYLEQLKAQIGEPNLVICLDSGCANYSQLWSTTSLRGLIGGDLNIEVMQNGIHSGMGSGVVPSVFCILRELLNRIEDSTTNKIVLDGLQVTIPEQRQQQVTAAAAVLQESFTDSYSLLENVQPIDSDVAELILNRTWRPALSVTGIDGLPAVSQAGNVTLPQLTAKLSLRLPPTCNIKQAAALVKQTLEQDPPFGAQVTFNLEDNGAGWHAPKLALWLEKATDEASQLFFNKPAAYMGEGGSIPFMGMLGEMFPQAQFLITGVLGPKSNAHGPNEFLHIDMAKKVTACVMAVIAKHFTREV